MGMQVEMVDKKGPHFPEPLKSPDDLDKARDMVERHGVRTGAGGG